MQITAEFPHDQYGTLILSGQYHEAEPDVNIEAHAVLESVLTYDGVELLAYANGNQVGVPAGDFDEMEAYLQFNGEPRTRLKPLIDMCFNPRRTKDIIIDMMNDEKERKDFEPWDGKNEPEFKTVPPNPWTV